MRFGKQLCAAGALLAALAIILAGCKPAHESVDSAPLDIRGQPIARTGEAAPQQKAELASAPTRKAAATSPAQARPARSAAGQSAYVPIGFDSLAGYDFETPNDDAVGQSGNGIDAVDEQIPDAVKDFNKRKVSLTGFMLPLKVQSGKVTEFLILKDQSLCCYGATPKMNEWVSVKVVGDGVKAIMDEPVSVLGTLHVGAIRESGYLIGIYSMEGEKLIGPN
jgi:hypothetical protein